MSFQLSAPQPLAVGHRVDDFACGEPVLDNWLKRRAMANQLPALIVNPFYVSRHR